MSKAANQARRPREEWKEETLRIVSPRTKRRGGGRDEKQREGGPIENYSNWLLFFSLPFPAWQPKWLIGRMIETSSRFLKIFLSLATAGARKKSLISGKRKGEEDAKQKERGINLHLVSFSPVLKGGGGGRHLSSIHPSPPAVCLFPPVEYTNHFPQRNIHIPRSFFSSIPPFQKGVVSSADGASFSPHLGYLTRCLAFS